MSAARVGTLAWAQQTGGVLSRPERVRRTEVSPQALRNHCLRSYAWGTILAARDSLPHDAELFYVTCLLPPCDACLLYHRTCRRDASATATWLLGPSGPAAGPEDG